MRADAGHRRHRGVQRTVSWYTSRPPSEDSTGAAANSGPQKPRARRGRGARGEGARAGARRARRGSRGVFLDLEPPNCVSRESRACGPNCVSCGSRTCRVRRALVASRRAGGSAAWAGSGGWAARRAVRKHGHDIAPPPWCRGSSSARRRTCRPPWRSTAGPRARPPRRSAAPGSLGAGPTRASSVRGSPPRPSTPLPASGRARANPPTPARVAPRGGRDRGDSRRPRGRGEHGFGRRRGRRERARVGDDPDRARAQARGARRARARPPARARLLVAHLRAALVRGVARDERAVQSRERTAAAARPFP